MIACTSAGTNSGSPVQLTEGDNSGTIAVPNNGGLKFYTTDASAFTMSINVTSDDVLCVPWETGVISSVSHANARLSWANVIDAYWKRGRYSLEGKMNDSTESFDSTVYNRKLKEFKIFYSRLYSYYSLPHIK
jgi:hypothetical protein